MKSYTCLLIVSLVGSCEISSAEEPKKECIGRTTFNALESMEWATYPTAKHLISEGGGHTFSNNISAEHEYLSYNNDQITVRVSGITTIEDFQTQRNAIVHKGEMAKSEVMEEIETNKKLLQSISTMGYSQEVLDRQKKIIADLEKSVAQTAIEEHDLGINNSHVLGSQTTPTEVLLWRNNRIYYFNFKTLDQERKNAIKDLIASFEPRNLYQVPTGPGVCMPYGFIHDDGNTGFSVKNSLRFTSTPNVILSLINASQGDPTKPTTGTYDTDYRPGYDAENWKKSKIMEKFYIGKRMTTLEGWRLDPRPESAEQDRAWFAIAHVGGLVSPLIAAQMFTFQKGTDGLKDLTPAPEAVIPKFLKLTQSISSQ
ncbi:hypothetical protein [Pseudomonas sp. NPDC087615]|uniref:hypothetical protein n=1 Tax=Pseudomonas sp. NPDC087615 TaxID=3364443 RepID=UPI0038221292